MKRILIAIMILSSFPINTSSVPSNVKPPVENHEFSLVTASADTEPVFADYNNQASHEVPMESGREEVPFTEEEAPKESEPETEISTIVLSFAGDCTLGDDESYSWSTFNDVYKKVNDPSYFLKEVRSVFGEDDFTFVNLEGALTKATKKMNKKYRHRGDPSYCQILTEGSVEGVTLANNHTMDYFEAGFNDTVDALKQAGIDYTYFETYFIKEIKGMKIGFLGYKGWSNEQRSNKLLLAQTKEMREQGVDFIIANYHWGDQKVYTPNASQRRMARFAIDNGVDLVIGHHPHVLQGMETYMGKNILYSLGNFCYGGSPNPADKDTIIYQQIITFDAAQKKIIASEYKIIPALISSDPSKNNYQPVIATGNEAERIIKKYESLSRKLTDK